MLHSSRDTDVKYFHLKMQVPSTESQYQLQFVLKVAALWVVSMHSQTSHALLHLGQWCPGRIFSALRQDIAPDGQHLEFWYSTLVSEHSVNRTETIKFGASEGKNCTISQARWAGILSYWNAKNSPSIAWILGKRLSILETCIFEHKFLNVYISWKFVEHLRLCNASSN